MQTDFSFRVSCWLKFLRYYLKQIYKSKTIKQDEFTEEERSYQNCFNKELEEVVAQVNRNFALLFERLEVLESAEEERLKTGKGGSKRLQQAKENA